MICELCNKPITSEKLDSWTFSELYSAPNADDNLKLTSRGYVHEKCVKKYKLKKVVDM